MKISLCYSLYFEKNEARRKELEKCLEFNLKAGFYSILILVEEADRDYVTELLMNFQERAETIVFCNIIPKRATFQDFFDRSADDAINVCCNADIFFVPEELDKVRNIDWNTHHNLAMCLNRYDVATFKADGSVDIAHHLNRKDSSDSFWWKGVCKVKNATNIPIGFCGSDNAVAFKFMEAGYKVMNPSNDLKTYHLHLTGLNNYRTADGHVKGEMVCHPPYWFHEAISLNDIK